MGRVTQLGHTWWWPVWADSKCPLAPYTGSETWRPASLGTRLSHSRWTNLATYFHMCRRGRVPCGLLLGLSSCQLRQGVLGDFPSYSQSRVPDCREGLCYGVVSGPFCSSLCQGTGASLHFSAFLAPFALQLHEYSAPGLVFESRPVPSILSQVHLLPPTRHSDRHIQTTRRWLRTVRAGRRV